MISASVCKNVDCKNNHDWGFAISPQFWIQINHAFSLQIQNSNNANVLLDSGLKLSDILVSLCSKLLDNI